mgnify:CR=1 FL=1
MFDFFIAILFMSFQYIICNRFKDLALFLKVYIKRFQYIICNRFNYFHHITLKFQEYLFQYIICNRFNFDNLSCCREKVRFNTLYVIGSIKDDLIFPQASLFQYIICNRFKIVYSNSTGSLNLFQYIICNRFKYLSALKICSSYCFNTLYVIGSK